MDFSRRTRYASSVNLTPLIDVVFLLIVFFMLSTSFIISESMELALPSEKAVAEPSKGKVMRIYIANDGGLKLDEQQISFRALEQYLIDLLGVNPDKKILVLADDEVSVQQLVRVMDMVYLSGGRNMAVADGVGR